MDSESGYNVYGIYQRGISPLVNTFPANDGLVNNIVSNPVTPDSIVDGQISGSLQQSAGTIFANKLSFSDTTAGYRLGFDTDNIAKFLIGNAVNSLFWNGTTLVINGSITATTGSIGGWVIGTDSLTSTGVTIHSGSPAYISFGAVPPTSATVGTGIYIDQTGLYGLSSSVQKVVIDASTGLLTATGANISGTITASAGTIGGFSIGTDYIRDTANSFGLASTVTGGNDVRFWAGDTFANRSTAPLRLYEDGSIIGTNATFTGALFATSGWIGSPTALVYESQGINTGTTGFIRGGQTSYNTGTGYFLGYDTGQYKLSIGNTTNFLTWDGLALAISGQFNINGTTITIDNTQDIQDYLDLIDTAGGGTLYLENGTYTLTSDISIPSGTTLVGVSRDGVIIDCDTSFKVNIIGSNSYTTGTLAISDTQTTVVGTGTTFTAGMIGRFIMLSGLWYEITARADNTHITISPAYSGTNLSGYGVVIADVNFAATISKVTIINGTTGLKIQYAQEYVLDDIIVDDCTTGVDIDDTVFGRHLLSGVNCGVGLNGNNMWGWKVDFSEFSNCSGTAGVVLTNSGSGTYFDSAGSDNTGDGINLTSCSNIAFISLTISGNGGQGIELVSGCNDIQFISFTSDGNASDGIKFTATSDRNTIVASTIVNNGGYGINIAASTCDNNQIIAPAFSSNTSGNINDLGTTTTVLPTGDIQTFTSSGTWTKPSGAKNVFVICIGGGGGGASGNVRSLTTNSDVLAGAGGGGGATSTISLPASLLPSTVAVTVATAAAGGAAVASSGTSLVSGLVGTDGGLSSFGNYIIANGGKGGVGGGGAPNGNGGYVTGFGTSVTPTSLTATLGQGATSVGSNDGTSAESGGGAGGDRLNGGVGKLGGSSIFGNGGGGGGGHTQTNSGASAKAGGASGATGSYVVGGGATGGIAHNSDLGGGDGGVGVRTGNGCSGGGGGGGSTITTTGGRGGNGGSGTVGGGGGGGGGCGGITGTSLLSGAGGAGGRGEVIVIST